MLTQKKRIFLLLAIFVASALFALRINHAAQAANAQQAGWTLVWGDEFNGSGAPSSANWNYHVGNGFNPGAATFDGWGNGEWEWYRPENCYQQNGSLVLKGEYRTTSTTIAGRQWYQFSCRITSDTKRSIQYGAIEARIQMPNTYGTWPAFWMMGDSCDDTSNGNYNAPITDYNTMASNWASCGEIDIMEHRNSDTTVVNNLFWDTRTGLFPWNGPTVANAPSSPNVGNVATFHTYRLEWTSTQLKWLIDGNVTKTIDTSPSTLEEFRQPFHLIMNMAISGTFTGNAQPNIGDFPTYTYVDYVRVYQAGSQPGGIDSSRWYDVVNANSGKCVDARSSATANGTAIQQYDCNNTFAQHFQFQPTSGGYYRINNRNNAAQVLDVAGVSSADGGLIHLWAYGGGNNQQWLPQQNANGTWRFISRHSGKCLDVPGSSTANSVQLQQWTCNNTNAQNFTLRLK
jgi:beta-glucanase (GH16 family)